MKVSEIMTRSIVSVNSDDSVERAAEVMKEHNIGAVPVCDGNKIIGIITDRDIALRSVAAGENSKNQIVRDVMSSNPVTGRPEMNVLDASRIMSERQIRRLPVVDNDNLVGIVSLGDIAVRPALEEEAESALSSISEPSTPEV
ncbi:CBS domain-containing protein [Clostridium thailandense]|uniref:CBS domain-containing protein n=1 Tax=Clostridium thailandense TaxID=2794346 RepID=A0A949TTM8_9CLOT|nr:CBS domain-containing protein [Clostridium thailandense]MBV7272153.1 CBS domain-containing protein [Clostridium thailandense]MCH5135995.1 CBS domain-containing protein [Clostridiaceae bacterium UIB06]